MEVPDPEMPGTEDEIQKDQIQKVLNKLQHQMSYVFIIFFIISIPIAICCILLTFIVLI